MYETRRSGHHLDQQETPGQALWAITASTKEASGAQEDLRDHEAREKRETANANQTVGKSGTGSSPKDPPNHKAKKTNGEPGEGAETA